MDLTTALEWRYATKQMNGQRVPDAKVDAIIEAIRLAPTSSGIQPFELISITNPALKEKIQPHAYNQPQVTQSSHLLVFAAWTHYTPERINKHFEVNNALRGVPASMTDDYRLRLLDVFGNMPVHDHFHHAAKQAAIALGFGLVAAAVEEVDSTPMEGFDRAALDEILELPGRQLGATLLLPLGYRDADNDWLLKLKKIRKTREELVQEIV